MARTTEQVLEALRGIIPPAFHGDGSILSGIASAIASAEATVDDLYEAGLWGGATDEWLDLHASGWDLRRADGETDASLRVRLRSYPSQVIPSSVWGVVEPLVEQAGGYADDVRLMEHWDDGAFIGQAYCGQENARIGSIDGAFSVIVPDAYGDPLDVRYAGIVWAVEGVRPHGARWWLVIDLES